MPNLSTTAYAILGLLSLRSWTTYELAEQMRRALGQFWPRAESGIYTEPKKLVAAGWATSKTEFVGKRARERYSITPAGRRALRRWVSANGEGGGPTLEFEQLIRVFFAEHASRDDLLRILREIRTDNAARAAANSGQSEEYLEGRGRYPERLPWLILCGRFLDEFEQLVERWSAWAIEEVSAWPDDLHAAEPAWDVLREMRTHADAFRAYSEGRLDEES